MMQCSEVTKSVGHTPKWTSEIAIPPRNVCNSKDWYLFAIIIITLPQIMIYLFDFDLKCGTVTSQETTLMVQYLHNGAPPTLSTCTLSLLLSFHFLLVCCYDKWWNGSCFYVHSHDNWKMNLVYIYFLVWENYNFMT